MSFYFYYQLTPTSDWVRALAEAREPLLQETQYPFSTVLDLDSLLEGDTLTAEDFQKVRYKGPLYWDIDNSDAETAVTQFKKLLAKLEVKGVNLEDIRMYATGGRGFHIEIPPEVFIQKPDPKGYQYLPSIYKEMVYGMYVDSVDLAVYSAKRGRMWRTPNIERTNGKYKVILSVDEARRMDVELYDQVTSAPRQIPPWRTEGWTFSNDLALAFVEAKDKVHKGVKGNKRRKADERLVEKWKGKLPPTLETVMSGEALREDKGFQMIATQLAIAAHALGKPEDEFLASCEGLIQNHKGDSTRYGTPAKRRAELSRMYAYMDGNPCYDFSIGGLKSIIAEGTATPDLDGGFQPDPVYDDEGNLISENPEEDMETEFSLTVGVKVNRQGIWKTTEKEGLVLACSLGLDNPSRLVDGDLFETIGYDLDVYQDGKKVGRRFLTMDQLTSVHKFLTFVTPFSATLQMTDAQVRALPDILRKRTEMRDSKTYTVKREGVDMVRLPEGEAHEMDMIYAQKGEVISRAGIRYVLKNQYSADGTFNSDLHRATPLNELDEKGKEECRKFLHKFFHLNNPEVVAKSVGFMLAAFISQPIRRAAAEFPLLQVYGTAGSGKSAYVGLLARLHYYRTTPQTLAGDSITKFGLEQALMSSASIPVIIDEVKPREMTRARAMQLKQMLRNNYNNNMSVKGYVNKDRGGANQLGVTHLANEAPIVFIGEAIESQSAIMDRSIVVTMTPEGRAGKSEDFRWCMDHRHCLSSWGWSCVQSAMSMSHEWLKKTRDAFIDILSPALGDRVDLTQRPLKNYATCLTGLQFGMRVLEQVFGDEFTPKIKELQQIIIDRVDSIVPFNMSEASKALNTLAYMSTLHDSQSMKCGEDYAPSMHKGKPCMDIVLRNAYDKYARFQKARGEELLFDNENAFFSAMQSHPAVVDRVCADTINTLKRSMPSVKVFRFDLEILYGKERVEEFVDIPNPTKEV